MATGRYTGQGRIRDGLKGPWTIGGRDHCPVEYVRPGLLHHQLFYHHRRVGPAWPGLRNRQPHLRSFWHQSHSGLDRVSMPVAGATVNRQWFVTVLSTDIVLLKTLVRIEAPRRGGLPAGK